MKLLEKLAHVTAVRRLEKRAYGYYPGMGGGYGYGGMNPYAGYGGMGGGYGGMGGGYPMEVSSMRYGPHRSFRAGMNPMFANILAQRHGIANQAATNALGPQNQMGWGAANMQGQYSPLVQAHVGQYGNIMGHAFGNPKNEYIDPQSSGIGRAAGEGMMQEKGYNADYTTAQLAKAEALKPFQKERAELPGQWGNLSATSMNYLYRAAERGDNNSIELLKHMGYSGTPDRSGGWGSVGRGISDIANGGWGNSDEGAQKALEAYGKYKSLDQRQNEAIGTYDKDLSEKKQSLDAYRKQQQEQTTNMTGAAAQQHNQTMQGVGEHLQRRSTGMTGAQNVLQPAAGLAQPGAPGHPLSPHQPLPHMPPLAMPSTSIGLAKGGSFLDILIKQSTTLLEDAIRTAGIAGGVGGLIGAPVGALAAGRDHRMEGAFNGTGIGMSTGLGSALGGMTGAGLGGLAGMSLGNLISKRTNGNPHLANLGLLAGAGLGGVAGSALGGTAGFHQGHKMLSKKETEKEAGIFDAVGAQIPGAMTRTGKGMQQGAAAKAIEAIQKARGGSVIPAPALSTPLPQSTPGGISPTILRYMSPEQATSMGLQAQREAALAALSTVK